MPWVGTVWAFFLIAVVLIFLGNTKFPALPIKFLV
ncbi:hypothetical protein J5U21_00809 [Saccharolobus shibatae]|uniref:Uncharacterized protein n=1 Tax=Saccharolobus shibatae TaxID=2286 RepID=A0A8F5BTJ8_9CREN|nr:hypothetical protein J5U21_00809 [Saccharolobus shibatae]